MKLSQIYRPHTDAIAISAVASA